MNQLPETLKSRSVNCPPPFRVAHGIITVAASESELKHQRSLRPVIQAGCANGAAAAYCYQYAALNNTNFTFMPIIIWAFAHQDTLVHEGLFNGQLRPYSAKVSPVKFHWQLHEQTEAVVWLKLMLA